MICIIGWIISGSLIGVFRDDPKVIAIGVVALRWQLCAFPLNSLILASNMLAQTCRKPWRANILAAARQGFILHSAYLYSPSTLRSCWALRCVKQSATYSPSRLQYLLSFTPSVSLHEKQQKGKQKYEYTLY